MSPHTGQLTPPRRSVLSRLWAPSSPYEQAHQRVWLGWSFLLVLLMPLALRVGPWLLGLGPGAADGLQLAAPLLAITLANLLTAVTPSSTLRVGARIHKMKERLRWFDGQPVTFAALPGDAVLDDALRDHGYERRTVDGASARTWRDLADALAEATARDQAPQAARSRALQVLAQLSRSRPGTALVLRRPENADPVLLADLTATWASQATTVGGGLLLLVDAARDGSGS